MKGVGHQTKRHLMVHTVWNLWAVLSFLLKLVSYRISAPRNHESPFHNQRQSGREGRCPGLGHVPKPGIHIPEDNVCGPSSRPSQVRKAVASSFCQGQAGICACFLPLLSQFLPPKRHFSGPDRPWQPESPLYSFWPQLRGETCHPHTPRALGLRTGTSRAGGDGVFGWNPLHSARVDQAQRTRMRPRAVQLRPCVLQAEASLQAVEGQYCWSRFAAPSLKHRGAVASRGQQRPKMPLLLRGKAKIRFQVRGPM